MKKLKWTILVIFCCIGFCSYGQKVEKENSIKRSRFPEKAIDYLNREFSGLLDAKYYREKTRDAVYYESKFEYQGDFFSIKFNEDGSLYDTEKLITEQEISDGALEKIKNHLDDDFKRWKIKKIQLRNFQGNIEYEIVVEGKKSKQVRVYEFQFSESGNFLKQEEIEGRFTDIMFF